MLARCGVAGQLVFQAAALVATPPAQPGEAAQFLKLPGGVAGDGVHVGQPRLGPVPLGDRGRQRLLAVGRPAGQHLLVLGDLLAKLAVDGPRVAAGSQCGSGWRAKASATCSAPSRWSARMPPWSTTATRVVFQVWVGWRERDWPV